MTDQTEDEVIAMISEQPCILGESALWDSTRSRFYWVDIIGQAIFAKDWATGEIKMLQLPGTVGSGALRESGGLVAVLSHAVAYCDVDLGTVDVQSAVAQESSGNRFNDGAVDPSGRFWFGSMDLAECAPTGSFYSMGRDGVVVRAFGGIICSNGPAWSPDGATMYHVDSTARRITAYAFDADTGTVGEGRLFVSDERESWYPDGVTVDAEGFVWNCKWGGGRVVRYAPDGTEDRVTLLPVPRPTRCAFVGPDLDLLAVTSARTGMSEAELIRSPMSGHVLLLDPSTRGLPSTSYIG